MRARACTKPCLPTTTNPCQPAPVHHLYWIGFFLIDFFTTGSISFLFDPFLYNGIGFCLIWSISVLRDRFLSYLIDFFTTGSISFWFDRFLYYGIHFFLIVLRGRFLTYSIDFFTTTSISFKHLRRCSKQRRVFRLDAQTRFEVHEVFSSFPMTPQITFFSSLYVQT